MLIQDMKQFVVAILKRFRGQDDAMEHEHASGSYDCLSNLLVALLDGPTFL